MGAILILQALILLLVSGTGLAIRYNPIELSHIFCVNQGDSPK